MEIRIKKYMLYGFLIIGIGAFAQPYKISWQTCYDLSGEERSYDLATSGNGYLFLEGYLNEDGQILVRKTLQDGSLVWERQYGGSSGEGAVRILKANDNYIIIGGTASADGDVTINPYSGSTSFWLVEIDSSGTILWNKVLGNNFKNVAMDGIISSDSGIVSFGYIEGGGGEVTNFYGERDMWLLKTDMEGNKLWDYTIGTSATDYGNCVIEASDKGFLLGGSSLIDEGSGGNINCQSHGWKPEAVLFKIDSAGNYNWQRCYGGSEIEIIHRIIELDDGYILGCSGYSDDGDMENSGYHLGFFHSGDRTPDIWIIKIDFDGNIIWQKCYGGTQSEIINDIYPLNNGNILVFASTQSFDGDVNGNHSIDEYYYDIWMFEINSVGNLLWQKCFGGPESEGWLFATYPKSETEFIINSTFNGEPNGDVECENTDFHDKGIWLFELSDSTTTGSRMFINEIDIYPNPVDEFMVVIPDFSGRWNISIFDILGRQLLYKQTYDNKLIVDFKTFLNGIYILKISDIRASYSLRKIIVYHH
jgi:hypothetical protein